MNQRFDALAPQWEEDSKRVRMAEAIAEAMTSHLALHPGQTLLDYGTGTGLVSMRLYPYVKNIVAVDTSSGMLEVLKQKLARWNVATITPRLGSWEQLDDLGGGVDVIVSSMALHHVPDTQGVVKMFYHMLRSGGQLAVADLDEEDGDFHADPTQAEHAGFRRDALQRLCEEAGFKDVSFSQAYTLVKPVPGGGEKAFTIFLMTARKD